MMLPNQILAFEDRHPAFEPCIFGEPVHGDNGGIVVVRDDERDLASLGSIAHSKCRVGSIDINVHVHEETDSTQRRQRPRFPRVSGLTGIGLKAGWRASTSVSEGLQNLHGKLAVNQRNDD